MQEAKKRYEGLTADQRFNRLDSAEGPYSRMELLRQINEDKNLGRLSTAQLEKYLGKDQKDVFKRYGQEKLYTDLRQNSIIGFGDADKEIEQMRKESENITDGDAKKKEEEIKEKEVARDKMLASYLENNATAAAGNFVTSASLDAKRGEALKKYGRIPAALDDASMKAMQRTIIRGITKGLSPHNVSSLMTEISKQNNVEGFKGVVAELKENGRDQFATLQTNLRANNPVLNWNDKKTSAVGLSILILGRYMASEGKETREDKGKKPRVVLTDERGNTIHITIMTTTTNKPASGSLLFLRGYRTPCSRRKPRKS